MSSSQPHEASQQELRQDLIVQVDSAIVVVKDLVAQLNDREREYMHANSVAYRRMVDTIAEWASSRHN